MISTLRRLSGTWPARLFFAALAAAFVGWGIAGRTSLGGLDPSSVATVDGTPIPTFMFNQAFKSDLEKTAEHFPDPSQIPAGIRREVAERTLQQLIAQQALDSAAIRMGLVAPDEAVQATITAVPQFQGLDGKFDYNTYLQTIGRMNLSAQHFQDEVRMDVTKNQILHTVTADVYPSDLLTNLMYGFYFETRRADLVQVLFSAHPAPGAPADTVLQRYYDNNLARYTAPEYRRVKLVVLSPLTIGRTLTLSDADLHAWYTAHKDEFEAPEKRSMQVITASTSETASLLAASWRAGATWDAIVANAKTRGASTNTLDNTTQAAIPAPELGQAAFGAALNAITGPVQEPLGFQVVRVTLITPAKHPTFESLRDTVRLRLGEEKALELIDERAQKLQDLFAGGNRIDEVPADLGAWGGEGTMDAQGNTQEGTKAPIEASEKARAAIIADAFKAQKTDSVGLTEGPDHIWYAISVQDIVKPAARPFTSVRDTVLKDWQTDQIHHATETDAAKLLATIKSGQTIANAAWGSGLQVTRTPPLLRNKASAGLTAAFVEQLFAMPKGEATMVETPTGFTVAAVAEITKPDPKSDAPGMSQIRDALTKAMTEDIVQSYAIALRDAGKPVVNQKVFESFLQSAPGE